MTFLQPFILWGLPLALLPILIHLLNRMRFRTERWAAMSFLFSANRASTRYAKLRQFLILACRVLALLALIAAIARPLAGGWIGWAFSRSPDAIVVLLDRSASMENKDATGTITRREQALRSIADAAGAYAEQTRFVLIENALRTPQEIARPELLPQLAMTAATDTAADLPSMLGAAADWLTRNHAGPSEIWIASDGQRGDWQPDSTRWAAVTARLAAFTQPVRVRLLALSHAPPHNASIALADFNRRELAGKPQLDLKLEIQRTETASPALPVTLTLDGTRSTFDAATPGQTARMQRAVPLDPAQLEGWGKLELPADGNARDNSSYFVYGAPIRLRVALVAPDGPSARVLRLAAVAAGHDCEAVSANGEGAEWTQYALVIWQAPLPGGPVADALQRYVEAGGVALFFPPGTEGVGSLAGLAWRGIEQAESAEQPFRIAHRDEQDGPFAITDEGLSLPLGDLAVLRRQTVAGATTPRAGFPDATPFLAERALGRGVLLFCATLPQREWSNLSDGRVLVPMVQRLAERGGKRFSAASSLLAGDEALLADPSAWTSVDAAKKDARFDAGIYRNSRRLIAVNRPASEDNPELLRKGEAQRLFGRVPVQFFEERGAESGRLHGEIWRTLLIIMLALLIAEAALSLPLQSVRPVPEPVPMRRTAFAEAAATP